MLSTERIEDTSSPQTTPVVYNGEYTIKGPRGHRTFRISTVKDRGSDFSHRNAGKRILAVMVGTDNEAGYKKIGWFDGGVKIWANQKGTVYETLGKVFEAVVVGKGIPGYEYMCSRRCRVCDRLLTSPESIERGVGPECADRGRPTAPRAPSLPFE